MNGYRGGGPAPLRLLKELGWLLPSTRLLKQGNWEHTEVLKLKLSHSVRGYSSEDELKERDQLNEHETGVGG